MTEQSEDASLLFVVPNFDFEVVTTGNEERLLIVKCNSSYWTIMLVELLQQSADAIVPQLYNASV